MIFMIMALIILAFILLWNFDLHAILHLKSRAQNAGDAAALGAARWQGISLNLIGDLNIMQAVALSGADGTVASQIAELQARLCFVGPAIGLLAAQQAAKNNGLYVNADFSAHLGQHAHAVLTEYQEVFAEPYPNCWQEYGGMLQNIASQGLAAAPDNARLYTDYAGSHTLLEQDFYDAVAAHDWCWFYFHAMSLLENYSDYHYWPELPALIPQSQPSGSEIFGLGLLPRAVTLPGGLDSLLQLNQLRSERRLAAPAISDALAVINTLWYVYDPLIWTSWINISSSAADPFPVLAPVRPQYDYAGADAAIRIETTLDRLTPGSAGSIITWTAAAKPFGYLLAAGSPIRPDAYGLVLPAFHNVRLIPVDASSAPEGGSYNLAWREHISEHLPHYLEHGLAGLRATCWQCQQLRLWEEAAFRAEGLNWLRAANAHGAAEHPCELRGGPGGPGGGRRRGH